MSKQVKLLDCTLRDGGYYTNWNFDKKLVRDLVHTLDFAKVDIIELGYKSPKKGGLYRKCNDKFIWEILENNLPKNSQLAFMIDAKDFIKGQEVDFSLIDDVIHEASNSPFSICRLAIKSNELHYAIKIGRYVLGKGYKLLINLMGISLLDEEQINEVVVGLEDLDYEALYLADSYGNLTPERASQIVHQLYKSTPNVGIHTHDNLGLAFANCLEALKCGVRYIDGTLLGMGRGVGNVKTEQLIAYFENKKLNYFSKPVSKFVYKWMTPLKQKYKWGFTHNYLISGLKHIHPLYTQTLQSTFLDSTSIESILAEIKDPINFNLSEIEDKIKPKVAVIIPARYRSSRFPGKPLAKIHNKEMIIWVSEIAEKAVGRENVYIATENEEIVHKVKTWGYKVILTSDDCLTGTDRVAQAALEIDADIIVNIQGDEPMLDPSDITKVIDAKLENPNHVINCFAYLNNSEDVTDKKIPKIITNINDELIYSSRNAIPGTKTGNGSNPKKQVCIYAFTREELKLFTEDNQKTPLEFQEDIEILRFIEKGVKVKMIELSSETRAVDYPEDIQLIEKLILK